MGKKFHSLLSGVCALILCFKCVFCLPVSVNASAWDLFRVWTVYGELITQEDAAEEETELQKKVPVVLSLGDSFSAGEGNEPYYGQNDPNKYENEDWLSHRSQNAWPGRLTTDTISGALSGYKEGRVPQWYFWAQSGAITDNYDTTPFRKEVTRYTQKDTSKDLPLQNKVFSALSDTEQAQKMEYEVRYVTLSMSGNDVGFAEVIKEVLLNGVPLLCTMGKEKVVPNRNSFAPKQPIVMPQPGQDNFTYETPAELRRLLNSKMDYFDFHVKYRLKTIYADILEKSGENACLLVVGYPKLFCSEDMRPGYLIKPWEGRIVNEYIPRLNARIEMIVNNLILEDPDTYLGRIKFISVEEAFDGHGMYSTRQPSFMNEITTMKGEDLKRPTTLKDISAIVSGASVHPNELGLQAYANCVQPVIELLDEARKNATIRIYVEDEDGTFFDGTQASVTCEDRFGEKYVLEPKQDRRGTTYFTSGDVEPGQFRLTVSKPGCPAMSVVREIEKYQTSEFTFLFPAGVGTPEDTVKKLEHAINNFDQEELLSCFDDSMNQMYDGMLGLSEYLTDLPLEALTDIGGGLMPLMKELGFDVHYRMEIKDVLYAEDGQSCLVTVYVVSSGFGSSSTEEQQLPMHLVDREWLISFEGLGEFVDYLS